MKNIFVLNRYNVGTCACNPPKTIVAPSIERLCSMFNVRYFAMHLVQVHAGAINKLSYGFASVRAIILSLKLVDYLPVHTHKPYYNLH